jgi:TPR repeat protein
MPAFLSCLMVMCAPLPAQTAAELVELKNKAGKGDAESQYELGKFYLGKDLKEAGAWYRKAADQGHAKAQSEMGVFNKNGWIDGASPSEAKRWWLMAAAKGDADACSSLALEAQRQSLEARLKGDATLQKQFRDEAIRWYTKAAEAGDRGSQFELGEMYNRMNDLGQSGKTRLYGITDADCDYESAMKWYLKAAKSKYPHPGAMYRIGMLYLDGKGVPQNTQTAIKWLELGAKGGAGWASEALTDLYRSGKATKKNTARALELLNKEAERGSHEAHRDLGLMYYYGEEVARDFALAYKHLSAIAESPLGTWDAQVYNALGHLYEDGEVTPQDLEKAFKYHLIGAKAGYPTGQFSVGYAYQFGRGTKVDFVEAVQWYRLSAESGVTQAQINLAALLMLGKGTVSAEPIEGFKWYKKAAVSGSDRAQMGVAISYYTGRGAPKDYVEAYAWANLAAASGKVERSKELREDIEAKLSPEQIAEGQQRSKELNKLINEELDSLKQLQKAIELRERLGA